ncbi:TonB-linked outer membrane protein, SusC/RagA family [Pedobacter sp. ok626]|uniref:SusC/RagA family TonB-linked outer membrane protein n=1 Tax=Pedobacter sp. ok626 TaxID=1761882 RepID=UPI00088A4012|nr:TonB-dependent receptor [Pedobacter sp. ok626]SDK26819.1 TonB-linked outer membrane protein, SusC/RagA family [Pedobacter sp. ok626]
MYKNFTALTCRIKRLPASKILLVLLFIVLERANAAPFAKHPNLKINTVTSDIGSDLSTYNDIYKKLSLSGIVTDETGSPIPGATVVEKGIKNGVVTDAAGQYKLNVNNPNSTLIFSSVGYETKEIKIAGQTIVNVQLSAKTGGLNEIVVVGYGTQKKVSLTGAVASITGAEIETTKSQSLSNMLTGKIPGVRIVQNTSEPGNFNNNFDIRGFGTPLFIVDGVPRPTIERLDPNDIESISVLKDASAAVYGVRAGNGVVLITTKKGKAGTSQISLSYYQGIQHAAGVQTPLDAVQYMTLINEKSMRSLTAPVKTYTDAQIAEFTPGGTKKSTDWFAETFRLNAPQKQGNIALTGGTEKVTYYIGAGYVNQSSFYRTNAETYNKYSFRTNLTANITKGLTANVNLNYIADTRRYPTQDFQVMFNSVYRNPPIYPSYAGDPGNHLNNFGDHGFNAVAYSDLDIVGYRNNNKKTLQSSFDLIYNVPFIPGLKVKGLYSYDNVVDDNKSFNRQFDLYQAVPQSDGSVAYMISQQNNPSVVSQYYNTAPNTLMQFSLNYNRTIKEKHTVSGSVLYEEGTMRTFGFSGRKFVAISTLDQLAAGGDVTIGSQSYTQQVGGDFPTNSATRSLIGILHYDYKGKYLLDATGRRDGSSNFSPSRRFGFFPGATAAWRISEEGFVKNHSSLSFINNLKLRASYGQTGNASNVDYQFLTAYDYPGTGSSVTGKGQGYVFDGTYVKDIGFREIPNTAATWETIHTINIGLDADFWKGLFGFSVDVFQRQRKGILAAPTSAYPSLLGAALSQQNLNSNQTNGVDIQFTHRNRIGNLGIFITGNASVTRTKNVSVVRGTSGNSYANWLATTNQNRYNDILLGYGSNGRFNSFSDIYNEKVNYGSGNLNLLPGDYRYLDWNGDGTFDSRDQYIIGTTGSIPLVNMGLTIALNYQNFDLNMLFQGAAGRTIGYNDASLTPLQFNDNAFSYFLDRWRPVDPNADMFDPHTQYIPGYYSTSGTNPNASSVYNQQDASYMRLKSLEIGYTIPVKWSKIVGVQKARIYGNGYNLFTVTGLKNYDPEHPNTNRSNEYPLNKTYNLGVNVTF